MGWLLSLLLAITPVLATEAPKPGVLVYRDGDRVTGEFVGREGDELIFDSRRFGRLRVPASEAFVEMLDAVETERSSAPASGAVAEREEPRPMPAVAADSHAWYSPQALTFALRQVFGQWSGRFAFSTELVTDHAQRNNYMVEGQLRRKWERDEVQMNGRYTFSETNEAITTDLIRADGLYRHDFDNRLFAHYRPTMEWNRQVFRNNQPADYVSLQQEVGSGFNVVNSEARKLRLGVAITFFDTWVLPTDSHVAQTLESAFAEIELRLPWRITLTERGVFYYSFRNRTDGWENRLQLDKKLTETISVALRHEKRRNEADVRLQDYELMRFLIGFDF